MLHSVGRGALECAFVMHTVGPHWYSDRDDDECFAELQATFTNVLDYADTVLQSVSIAVPPVGTGKLLLFRLFDCLQVYSFKQ